MRKLTITVFIFIGLLFIITPLYIGIRGELLGSYGDSEQFIWQIKNLSNVVKTGDFFVRDSFFGINIPYSFNLLNFVQGGVYLVIQSITNNVFITYNLTIGLFLFANFLSMYFVLKKFKFKEETILLFSSIYSFSSGTLIHSLSHPGLFITFIFPIFFYLLIRLLKATKLKYCILLAIVFSLSFYIHEYFTFGLGVILLIFGLFNFKSILQNLKPYLVFLFISITLLFPGFVFYYNRLNFEKKEGIETFRTSEEANYYSSNPFSYVFPSNNSIVSSKLKITKLYLHRESQEHLNYLGIINIILLGYIGYLIYKRKFDKVNNYNKKIVYFLIVGCLTMILISFGPYIRLNQEILYLPIAIGYKLHLPVITSLRSYGRFGMIAFCIIVFFTAYIFNLLLTNKLKIPTSLSKILNGSILGLIILLLIGGSFLDQYPFSEIVSHPIPIPSIIYDLPTQSKDSYVMNVPFAGNMPLYNGFALFFQTIHHKNIVNGYAAFEDKKWLEKISHSSARCFNLIYYLDPSCDNLTTQDIKKDNIEFIIYEKTYFNKTIFIRTEKLTKKIYEDKDYLIGQII